MIVCHCENVNDRTVGAAVAAGATDVPRVAAACRAGRQCGGCHDSIERIVEQVSTVNVTRARRAVA